MPDEFVVRGVITDTQQRPVAGVSVRAFDRDLPSLDRDELLGYAVTNDDGLYEIGFDETRFRTGEVARADVYIEALNGGTTVLARSPVRFNADREARIDLRIEAPVATRESEFEHLVALVAGVI